MEFALAGYAKKDLEICYSGQELTIRSVRSNQEVQSITPNESLEEEVIPEVITRSTSSPKIQQGAIVRGIARRNFSTNFFISQEFDISSAVATVKDGLLHLIIPAKSEITANTIEIKNGE